MTDCRSCEKLRDRIKILELRLALAKEEAKRLQDSTDVYRSLWAGELRRGLGLTKAVGRDNVASCADEQGEWLTNKEAGI